MVVVGAAEDVQHAACILDRVEPETAANYKPQIQTLELVVLVVVEDIHKQARAYVVVIADSAANRLGGAGILAIDQSRSLDRVEIERNLVRVRDPRRVDSR